MVPSLVSTITALFSKPRRMDVEIGGFELAFRSTAKHETEVFLYFFIGEALQAKSDPMEVLDRLIVEKIYHNKINSEPPAHELLIIHTRDISDGTKRDFILERMVARTGTENTTRQDFMNIDNEIDGIEDTPLTTKIYDTIKKSVDAIFAALSSESESDSALPVSNSDQISMEEGTSHTFSSSASASTSSESFSVTDSVTVSVSESADAVSDAVADSLDQSRSPALDRFLGESYTRSSKWTGTTLRHFKPNHLTFYEFVLLAYVVHKKYPIYTRLGKNCMFYASLVYDTAERHGGNADTGSNNTPYGLGRYKGFKVSQVESRLVSSTVKAFKRVLARQSTAVSLCSCLNCSH